jgi:hypothetical protein
MLRFQKNHFPPQDNRDQERIRPIVGRRDTTPTVILIRFQGNGTSQIEPKMSQATTAIETRQKNIAAHLRRKSSPMPITVAEKKNSDIRMIADGVKGPSCLVRELMRRSSISSSKRKIRIPSNLISDGFINVLHAQS